MYTVRRGAAGALPWCLAGSDIGTAGSSLPRVGGRVLTCTCPSGMRVSSTAAIAFWQRRSESELCEPVEQRAAKETPSPDKGQGAEAEVGPDKSEERP